ncbi:MAG TPA: hypothetical protein VMZ05_01530 [Spirochaetota bacterium]|nr:hypothetical protein [Spirochaetota bacterium]
MRKWTVILVVSFLILSFGLCYASQKKEEEAVEVTPTEPGKPLSGITLKCAFIGGANYEELYKAIPEFESETGAEVEIVFKGDGFQIDKKLKTDFAAGTVDYDVC